MSLLLLTFKQIEQLVNNMSFRDLLHDVENVEERINLYQKLNQINNDDELKLFQTNLIDRFGKMPTKINNLFNAIKLVHCLIRNFSIKTI